MRGDVAGDHGQPERHGLEHAERQSLLARGRRVDVEGGHAACGFFHLTREDRARAQSEARRPALGVRASSGPRPTSARVAAGRASAVARSRMSSCLTGSKRATQPTTSALWSSPSAARASQRSSCRAASRAESTPLTTTRLCPARNSPSASPSSCCARETLTITRVQPARRRSRPRYAARPSRPVLLVVQTVQRVNRRHARDASGQPPVQTGPLAVRVHQADAVATNQPDQLHDGDRIQTIGAGLRPRTRRRGRSARTGRRRAAPPRRSASRALAAPPPARARAAGPPPGWVETSTWRTSGASPSCARPQPPPGLPRAAGSTSASRGRSANSTHHGG